MIHSLDTTLFLQIAAVLASTLIFTVILEGFGWLLLRLVSRVLRSADKAPLPDPGFIIRVFGGGLLYTLVFLGLGVANLLTPFWVLAVSLAVPVLVFLVGRRWPELGWQRLKLIVRSDWAIILGTAAFGVLTFVFWFRPTTNFDGVWYHLTIPKLFLQNHNVRNQGGLLLYSLQPSMDYFWNLWALALPVSTAVASIIINSVQALLVGMSLAFAAKIGKKVWGWSSWQQFLVPIILGFSYEGVCLLGLGGNDLVGLAYGLAASLYCFYLLTRSKVTWGQLTVGLLLIVGLATVKLFFTIYAVLVLAYLLTGAWPKLPAVKTPKRQVLALAGLLLIIFVTYLPWLIRAYLATGRPLDPLGTPGLNAQFYFDQGGGTALNHWTNFVFTRFYASIGPMLFFIYSPLVLVGVLSIFHKAIRAKAANLWLLALAGFWLVFFASITIAWRYYMPEAVLLSFLGIATLIELGKQFDVFGHLAVWAMLGVLVMSTILRVIYTTPATAGANVTDASIQRLLYVRHFSGTNSYLDKKITADYGYVQEQSPPGLSPHETILIGNTYQPIPLLYQPLSDYDQRNIHNLAYVKNPFLEPTMAPNEFKNLASIQQFIAVLQSNRISYIVSRKSMSELCRYVGVPDPQDCEAAGYFKPVLADRTWNVNWYKVQDN